MKLRNLIGSIPPRSRRGKLIRNVLCIALLALAGYIILGGPAVTPRQEFRRMERAWMREPADILAVVRTADLEFPPEGEWKYGQPPAGTWARAQMQDSRNYVIGRQEEELVCMVLGRHKMTYQQIGSTLFAPVTGDVTLVRAADYQNDGALYYVYTTLPGAYRVLLEVRTVTEEGNSASGYWFRSSWCAGTGENQGNGVFVVPILPSSDLESTDEVLEGVLYQVMETHVVITSTTGETIYDETQIYGTERGNAGEP